MKRHAWLLSGFAILIAVIGFFACTPTSPSPPLPNVTITTSDSLDRVGQTAQLTAHEVSNGSTVDVTATAVWTSSDLTVVTVSATGLAKVIGPGTATITAFIAAGSKTGALRINVPLTAAAQVQVHVLEQGGLGLPGAVVTLLGGPMDGQTVTTDAYGEANFLDASNAVQIRAMKSGYITATENIAPNNGNNSNTIVSSNTTITLSPTVPYTNVAGTYQATLTASPSCQLPSDVKTRVYSATIAQDNARLTITFSGTQFTQSNAMEGRIFVNSVNLNIGTSDDSCFYYQQQCFVENLSGGRTLTLNGTGSGQVTGSTIATQVAGVIIVATGGSPTATCTAPDHHLTFSR